MKQHLTDDETFGFWMPGPKDEKTFIQTVNHVQQCTACRDRLWAGLLRLRSLTDGLAKVIHKTMATSPLEEVAGKLTPPEFRKAMDIMGEALDKIRGQPEKTEWTSKDLFGTPVYGQAEHFATCDNCHHRMNLLLGMVHSMRSGAETCGASPLDIAAIQKLEAWFEAVLDKAARLKRDRVVNPLTGGTDSVQTMCN